MAWKFLNEMFGGASNEKSPEAVAKEEEAIVAEFKENDLEQQLEAEQALLRESILDLTKELPEDLWMSFDGGEIKSLLQERMARRAEQRGKFEGVVTRLLHKVENGVDAWGKVDRWFWEKTGGVIGNEFPGRTTAQVSTTEKVSTTMKSMSKTAKF